jgi:ferrous iron transport protein A
MSESKTLDQIPKGQFVQVIKVEGDDPIARRLDDLGVREGVRIEVLRRAPLGDPTVFELCHYQLCLRRSESARIRVRTLDESAPTGAR